MMYLVLRNNVSKLASEIQWHVGEKLPCDLSEKYTTLEVQADGDELVYIVQHFHNLPIAHICAHTKTLAAVQKWRGDFAAFIADNLPQKV